MGWSSGRKHTKYSCDRKVCYSLRGVEVWLGREMLNSKGQQPLLPVPDVAGNEAAAEQLQGDGVHVDDALADTLPGGGLHVEDTLADTSHDESANEWACSQCTFHNTATALACGMCGLERPSDGAWFCSVCSCENMRVTLVCVACCTERPNPEAWSCLRCETYSPPEELACVSCGLDRDQNRVGGFQHYVDSDSDRDEPEENSGLSSSSHQALTSARAGSEDLALSSHGDAGSLGQRRQAAPSVSAIAQPGGDGDGASVWRCGRCTFDNSAGVLICAMCDGSRAEEWLPRKRRRPIWPALNRIPFGGPSGSVGGEAITVDDSPGV